MLALTADGTLSSCVIAAKFMLKDHDTLCVVDPTNAEKLCPVSCGLGCGDACASRPCPNGGVCSKAKPAAHSAQMSAHCELQLKPLAAGDKLRFGCNYTEGFAGARCETYGCGAI